MSFEMHRDTPTLLVHTPRKLTVRTVQFRRTASEPVGNTCITQCIFDNAGRLVITRDARQFDTQETATQTQVFSLSGATLLTLHIDSGWHVRLAGEAGQLLNSWDGRSLERRVDYDDLLRPIAIIEQNRAVERFGYGAADAFGQNQCNQVIRHDDPAGSSFVTDYGVSGAVLDEARSFLLEPVSPDWPLAEPGRDALLESDRLHTRRTVNALGEVLEQTDVCGNVQQFHQTVAGQLKSMELTRSGVTQTLVSDLRYNAFNQVEQETAGNGVISHYVYDPHTGRLNELLATSADGGALQHLKYAYDPVGNVLEIEDAAQPIRFFSNQRIEPVQRYTYDTLYQLIEATGFEVKTDTSHGPGLPGMQNLPPDPNQIRNYTQTYDYDAAGNLLTMHHVGAQNFTRTMRVAPDSNRSLPEGEVGTDFADSFDANGNLLQLVRGKSLSWDARNQLQQITTVQRDTGLNDEERYVYDGQGQRVRKLHSAQASGRALINEVRYLPGLEIRTTADGEILHVITAQSGRNGVQVLHWEAGKPNGIASDQVRYSLTDHLGSSTLELDQQGGLISQESYYPFGGTAWWAGRSAVEAKYKTVRYSGRERDASGLYYYGLRYYAPWLQRWISPDPMGTEAGLNLYAFTFNNPLRHIDYQGAIAIPLDIFVSDIVNVMNRSIGTGEFEELTWDVQAQGFSAGNVVYGRNLSPMAGSSPVWEPSESGSAFALFRDTHQTLRLFVNNDYQHMGIQPGMGLPVAAGVLKKNPQVPGMLTFDNSSGHYKPDHSIDVGSLLKELTPESASVNYTPSDRADNVPRITTITSPEDYADKVEHYKNNVNELIPFLKEQGLWEHVQTNASGSYSYEVLNTMDERGMNRAEASNFLNRRDFESALPRSNPAATRPPRRIPPPASPPTPSPRRSPQKPWYRRLSNVFGRH
ncbi:RHS repeat domain-containing protein [Pseudomonas viridiflava]|uniref:RHS repeat domain-containing protein n=1 Tax=Pseudomonas viridiflava TaxID=33069 RepID=UPI0018E65C61|nr:RHS repeat protein [Pseudomonas viridiflava]MBI6705939.1 RHS repeat protein [Pseudomonas viridiflava]MBI6724371.1 RHS repeat protein [Pseudomonas viridiflava]